MVKIM